MADVQSAVESLRNLRATSISRSKTSGHGYYMLLLLAVADRFYKIDCHTINAVFTTFVAWLQAG